MAMTEDEVRNCAQKMLFNDVKDTERVEYGTGQITHLNRLGFPGSNLAPDGWWLPYDESQVAVVFEFKDENKGIDNDVCRKQLFGYMDIVSSRYRRVCGVSWDGRHIEVYTSRHGEIEQVENQKELEQIGYYFHLFEATSVDKQKVYKYTAAINNTLHFEFGVKNLYQRMIVTACALIAQVKGARLDAFIEPMGDKWRKCDEKTLSSNRGWVLVRNTIAGTLNSSLTEAKRRNYKLQFIEDEFSHVEMNMGADDDDKMVANNVRHAVGMFLKYVCLLSEEVTSDKWHGTDVMAIFFNEFTRYKGKSEAGQVFTPEHIADFMCELIEVNSDDRVLDACCGSGTFLCKAMSKMMDDAGGYGTAKAERVRREQLFGIEFDREIFALACASMLLHKDGKTNLEQLDSRYAEAGSWIAGKGITKVLMNPPYERKYGCIDIVLNVMKNVPRGCRCAFILPDKKLEKEAKRKVKELFEISRLTMVLKLPDVFFGVGVSTSIFVFEAGVAQGKSEFWACDLGDDGFEVVKNKGRHDVRDRWSGIEQEWLKLCQRKPEGGEHNGQWHTIDECMSYQEPEKPFEIYEEDFRKTAVQYMLFQKNEEARKNGNVVIDTSSMNAALLSAALYQSRVEVDTNGKKQLVIDLG